MAVLSGCKGKVYVDDELVAHVSAWTAEESVNITEFEDSSTNCAVGKSVGSVNTTGTFTVNMNDSEKPLVIRAGVKAVFQLHIDDTELNYYEAEGIVETASMDFTISSDIPTSDYAIAFSERLVGYGRCADDIS